MGNRWFPVKIFPGYQMTTGLSPWTGGPRGGTSSSSKTMRRTTGQLTFDVPFPCHPLTLSVFPILLTLFRYKDPISKIILSISCFLLMLMSKSVTLVVSMCRYQPDGSLHILIDSFHAGSRVSKKRPSQLTLQKILWFPALNDQWLWIKACLYHII